MQNGAVEAYWAHNPEVRGSKPRSAILFSFNRFDWAKYFFAWHKTIVLFALLVITLLKVVAPKRTVGFWLLKEPLVWFDNYSFSLFCNH